MQKTYLVVEFERTVARVDAEDIYYILRDGERIIVATGEKEYVYYESMKEAEKIMGPEFFQPRDRCIVNMEHLRHVDAKKRRLIFKNGDEVFLGRDACCKLKKAFKKYALDNNEDLNYAAEDENTYD